MSAIIRRELSAYFHSPIGYIFCAVYLFFSALFFRSVLVGGQSSLFPQIYYSMINIIMLILPILTMRLFSEERRQKTDQILLTSPVSIPALVSGKFIAAMTVYGGCVLFTLLYAVVFSFYTSPGWALVVGNVIGALLFGAAFIAVGMFISSLTESQVVAAIGSFFIAAMFIILDVIPLLTKNELVIKVVNWISFVSRYTPFTNGILDFSSIIFFLSVTGLFMFFTMQTLERRRWN